MQHPFMATNTVAAVQANPSVQRSVANTAKTIGQLNVPTLETLADYIRSFLIPVEFEGSEGAPVNFQVNIGQLIDAINASDIGLGNVDNTSDAKKPLSEAMVEALRSKLDSTWKPGTADIQGLEELLSEYRKTDIKIGIDEIIDLAEVLNGFAKKTHTHTQNDLPWLMEILQAFAPASHEHALSDMKDWAIFSQSLTLALNSKVTKTDVINIMGEKGLVIGVDEWP